MAMAEISEQSVVGGRKSYNSSLMADISEQSVVGGRKSYNSSASEKSRSKRRRDDDISDDEVTSCCCIKKLKSAAAEPLIGCAWSGDFLVRYDESIYWTRTYSMNAFVSSRACKKVHEAVAALENVLFLEMLPTSDLWPKSFERSGGPNDGNIALYFFPPLPLHQQFHESLICEMIGKDLAMRVCLGDSELLIFTSDELPESCERYQGKFYLWGVFRGITSENN